MYTLMMFENNHRFTIRQITEALCLYTAKHRENGLNLIQGDVQMVIEGAIPQMHDRYPIVLRRREVREFDQMLYDELGYVSSYPNGLEVRPWVYMFWYNTRTNKFYRTFTVESKAGVTRIRKLLSDKFNLLPGEGNV